MKKYAILVLGIARSGTSALSGTLSHLGIPFSQNLKEPDWQNPKGNYEHQELSQANQEILQAVNSCWSDHKPLVSDWRNNADVRKQQLLIETLLRRDFNGLPVFGLKDPRLVPLFELYAEVIENMGFEIIVISTLRNESEVIESIRRSGYYRGEFSARLCAELYQHYLQLIQKIHNIHGGLQIHYDSLISTTEQTIQQIAKTLPADFHEENFLKATQFIDRKLHRVRYDQLFV